MRTKVRTLIIFRAVWYWKETEGRLRAHVDLCGGYLSVITLKNFMELYLLGLCSPLYLYLIENIYQKVPHNLL